MSLVIERVCDWCGRRQGAPRPTDAVPDPLPHGWGTHERGGDLCGRCRSQVHEVDQEARKALEDVWAERRTKARAAGPT